MIDLEATYDPANPAFDDGLTAEERDNLREQATEEAYDLMREDELNNQ